MQVYSVSMTEYWALSVAATVIHVGISTQFFVFRHESFISTRSHLGSLYVAFKARGPNFEWKFSRRERWRLRFPSDLWGMMRWRGDTLGDVGLSSFIPARRDRSDGCRNLTVMRSILSFIVSRPVDRTRRAIMREHGIWNLHRYHPLGWYGIQH